MVARWLQFAPRMRISPRTHLALFVATAHLGCEDDGGSNDPSAATATDATTDGTSDAPTEDSTGAGDSSTGGPPSDAPTYYQDIAPVLSERCSGCHVAGGAAPLTFDTYEDAAVIAPLIRAEVAAGTMPPWPPGGETPPLEHDRSLTEDQIATVLAWVDAGSPEGDPATAAPLIPPTLVELPSRDVMTDIGADYVADASLTDDYHCFMIEVGTTEDRVATGYQFLPQNTKTVHHVLSTVFTADSVAAIEAMDAATPEPGWSCFGGYSNIPGADAVGSLGGWVPGVAATNYPDGTGTAIPAGAVVVAQIHYNTLGGTDPDRTRLELALAPAEDQGELRLLHSSPLPWPGFMIPAGASSYSTEKAIRASVLLNAGLADDKTGYILGIAAHMHMLGVEIELSRVPEDGPEQTLLHIPHWDFGWQGSYTLVEPIRVVGTDSIEIRCVYDNSPEHRAAVGMGPTEDVTWGEGTADEMCLGYLQVVDALP